MVREQPEEELGGWSFMSGTESQINDDEAANFGIYSVNTIANYDRDIIPLLDAPPGSSFERRANRGDLVPCDGTEWPASNLTKG